MSGSVTEFATITGSNLVLNQLLVAGEVFEAISEPYTDPLTGQTTELNEIIPISGLVSIADMTASGLVIPLGTVATYGPEGGISGNFYAISFQLPVLGANVLTTSVNSTATAAASSLPAGDTDTITETLQPTPIVVSQPDDVVTDMLNQPAPQADFTVAPFSQVTLTDANPLQLDSATISVTGQVPYTLSLPNLQDLSASALAAALDGVALTFTSATSGTDTVTATITDIAGLSTVLTTQASLIVTGAPPQPISASDAAAAVTDNYNLDAGQSANSLQLSPFQDVAVDDPNAGRLDSATITLSGPVAGTLSTTSLQNLPAAALAAAMDVITLTFAGETAGADTVTATITDSIGQTTTLTSTDGLAFTNSTTTSATPIDVATITDTNGTIAGTADEELLNSAAVPVLIDPLSDAIVAIYNDGTVFESVSTDGSGAFESPLLPATPSHITASVVPVLGSGPDTLALFISERGAPDGAQFTISVDGTQIGGVQTTTATGALPGQAQEFDIAGTFAAATSHTVSIDYLNADQSLLLLNSGTIDGTEIPTASSVLSSDGSAGFDFTAPTIHTIGSGADSILLDVSQSGATAGVKFTVAVNGEQIGGVQTVYTSYLDPGTDTPYPTPNFKIEGNFPNGTDTLTVTFLNANNSVLVVTGAELNGPSLTLTNDGSKSDTFSNQLIVPAVGSGPDALELTTSQAGEPAGAEFTVSVDGTQIGGVQTTTADNDSGQFQPLLVLGDFAPGANHTVSIKDLNASNSLLFVDSATINGTTIAGGSTVLSNTGSLGFSFATPGAPSPATIGSGPDTLALSLSEDYFQNNAQFTLSVDNDQVGGVQTVSAIAGNGQSQVLDVLGNFAGTHTVSIDFVNPASEGAGTPGLVRNLYVNGASVDGAAVANSSFSLIDGVTSQSFTFVH